VRVRVSESVVVQVKARGHKWADYALGLLYDASIILTPENQYN
jgi:hypothetical protein